MCGRSTFQCLRCKICINLLCRISRSSPSDFGNHKGGKNMLRKPDIEGNNCCDIKSNTCLCVKRYKVVVKTMHETSLNTWKSDANVWPESTIIQQFLAQKILRQSMLLLKSKYTIKF